LGHFSHFPTAIEQHCSAACHDSAQTALYLHCNLCLEGLSPPLVPVAALERLDVVAAPAPSQVAPLEAVLSVLRNTVQALEASQASAFGAQVDTPPTTSMPHCLSSLSIGCLASSCSHHRDRLRNVKLRRVHPAETCQPSSTC